MKIEKGHTQRDKAHKVEWQDWYLTLVALLANSPNEIPGDRRSTTMKDMVLEIYGSRCPLPAVRAECGLFKVDRHELVPVDLVHSATESPSPFRISETASLLEF